MSEPQYMQGDTIARSLSELGNHEHECECGAKNTIEVEEKYHASTREVTYWGEYKCPNCNKENQVEGWYEV
jgi:hypothetical protein